VLRKGVKFHNGDPVTADDVKYSFDRYHGAAAKLLKDRVREVEIVDGGRVRFHLKEPWPDFMTFYGTSATGAAWIVPKKYVENVYLLSGPIAADVKRTPGLRLAAAMPPGVVFLDLPEQWDPKSPWHDRRVRLAASHGLDRNALNQAETLGLSRPTGGLIPRV